MENTATAQKQGNHSKRDQKNRSARESRDHTGAPHKETKPHRRSRNMSESSSENDRKKADISSPRGGGRGKGDDIKRERRRYLSSHSSSSRSPSVDREKGKQRAEVRSKRSRERVGLDIHQSPRKRKTSERESYKRASGEDVSSPQKDNYALSSFHEKSVENFLKKIREHSGKDAEMHQTSADYRASKASDASLGDNRNTERVYSRQTELSSARHFKESFISKGQNSSALHETNSKSGYVETGSVTETSRSLGLRDQRSGSVRDRKASLVSYEASSDEGQS